MKYADYKVSGLVGKHKILVCVESFKVVVTPEAAREFADALIRVATAMQQIDDTAFFVKGVLGDVEE